mmetsp:Transcript_34250/g.75205  ORF Transcript_34250/g.75205 Transcript_34250/m.75205 type:complete len:267 (+) Transcript_34250:1095-1895(+)
MHARAWTRSTFASSCARHSAAIRLPCSCAAPAGRACRTRSSPCCRATRATCGLAPSASRPISASEITLLRPILGTRLPIRTCSSRLARGSSSPPPSTASTERCASTSTASSLLTSSIRTSFPATAPSSWTRSAGSSFLHSRRCTLSSSHCARSSSRPVHSRLPKSARSTRRMARGSASSATSWSARVGAGARRASTRGPRAQSPNRSIERPTCRKSWLRTWPTRYLSRASPTARARCSSTRARSTRPQTSCTASGRGLDSSASAPT